ncbi:MAG: NYN domain-containing protein [Acidobacteriota bacterium]|nr:NYN domain-containing protein [Blastocatellia bacterium]MDW8411668.1 NYN domain-containing protein [Acidobacteriota bacterium]
MCAFTTGKYPVVTNKPASPRGRIAIFIDGNNLFHAARAAGVEIDYAKLLEVLRGDDPLLRAFFYTGVDQNAERQQGFLLWMRRNGYRVVEKELKTFPDGTKKANLDVEIAVDMLSLADKYDTAILVSGDEDFAYAVNAVAYKGVRVEVAGFRSNTSPRLIDVADRFIELDSIVHEISKSERSYLFNASTGQYQAFRRDWPNERSTQPLNEEMLKDLKD